MRQSKQKHKHTLKCFKHKHTHKCFKHKHTHKCFKDAQQQTPELIRKCKIRHRYKKDDGRQSAEHKATCRRGCCLGALQRIWRWQGRTGKKRNKEMV
jgi:hypothetical protein